MMAPETLLIAIRLNLTVSAAILMILALRIPFRRWCGADLACRLWLLIPLVMIGDLTATVAAPYQASLAPALFADRTLPALPGWLAQAWVIGAAICAIGLLIIHAIEMRRVYSGRSGPAVVGLIRPRLCLPLDFTKQFTPQEQRLVRAHERMHLERHDVLTNAAMALLRCIFWFNPLIHVAARMIRHDQEMACDAGVIDLFPDQRRPYAAAMLKAQLSPLGIAGFGAHPLETRIAAIVRGGPLPYPRVLGAVLLSVGLFALMVGYASTFGGGAYDIADLQLGDLGATLMQLKPPA